MTWNMSHGNFGQRKLFFLIYAKLFPYTISNSESQMPFLWFLLGGGVCTLQASREVTKSGQPASSTSWKRAYHQLNLQTKTETQRNFRDAVEQKSQLDSNKACLSIYFINESIILKTISFCVVCIIKTVVLLFKDGSYIVHKIWTCILLLILLDVAAFQCLLYLQDGSDGWGNNSDQR